MARVAIVLVVLIALLAGGSWWYRGERAAFQKESAQISDLNDQLAKLRAENDRLKTELDKVQQEETRLAAINEALRKALEQAKLTGKVPSTLPYPPK